MIGCGFSFLAAHPAFYIFYLYQDQFLDRASELSRYFESELAQILSRSTTATRFFQRYSNTLSNPLKECHMRGVSSMLGVYENGLTGVLVDDGNG